MIGDDLEVIVKEVSEFFFKYIYVIISGGIGFIYDDKIFEGIESFIFIYFNFCSLYMKRIKKLLKF